MNRTGNLVGILLENLVPRHVVSQKIQDEFDAKARSLNDRLAAKNGGVHSDALQKLVIGHGVVLFAP
jgi:hypothetical protein